MRLSQSDIKRFTARVADDILPALQENLTSMAKAAQWPKEIINSLSVQFDGNSIIIDYPDDFSSEIDDLEYGKPFGLPNPVLRPFILRCEPLVTQSMANLVVDDLVASVF